MGDAAVKQQPTVVPTANGGSVVRNPRDPYQLCIFTQPGFKLSLPYDINRNGVIWSIGPSLHEKDGRVAIDLTVKITNLQADCKLYARFAFQQPGNEKHEFENIFDYNRNTFVYRRALTIPKVRRSDGSLGCQYSHYRFLRRRDDDEPMYIEDVEKSEWTPEMPLIWTTRSEVVTSVDMNGRFLDYISKLEKGMTTFTYFFTIDYQKYTDDPPLIKAICWPKPSKTGRYLDGKSLSVDAGWFLPTWPSFKKFMSNLDLLQPFEFNDLVDAFGHYYHGWHFKKSHQTQLVRLTEKFGFYDFAQILHSMGSFECYVVSQRSSMIANEGHALLNGDTKEQKPQRTETFTVTHPVVVPEWEVSVGTFRSFTGMTWTMCLSTRKYAGVEYLVVSCMINGPYKPGEHQLWQIDFGADSKNPKFLKKVTHTRALNSVQRTICFPTCYLWSDVVKEMGPTGPFKFKVNVALVSQSGWRMNEVAGKQAVNGVLNAEILCRDGKKVKVNKELLQCTCVYYCLWDQLSGTPDMAQVNANYNEMVHFLDHLYHGSKIFSEEMWKNVLWVANEVGCERVLASLERAAIRAGKQICDYPEDLGEAMLKYLKFHNDYKDTFGIISIDDYLNNRAESLADWNATSSR